MTGLLAIYYFFLSLLIVVAISGIGALILRPMTNEDWLAFIWNRIVRFAAGLATTIFIAITFGSVGLIRAWAILPFLGILSIAGWIKTFRNRSPLPPRVSFSSLSKTERVFLCVILGIDFLIFVNILIGGMCPAMMQDVLWYHMSVPMQWVLTGHAHAFPYVMPSNYSLGMESVYSVLLLFSNEILCSMLYAQLIFLVLIAMSISAYRFAGTAGALVTMGCLVPLVAVTAPILPVNDFAAMLVLLIAFYKLARTFEGERTSFFFVGFLLGTALAIKMITLIFTGPILFFWVVFSLKQTRIKALAGSALLIALAFMLAFAPWAVRGFRHSGDPVFPILSSIFPIKPEYMSVFNASRSLNNSYALNFSGVRDALTVALPEKLAFMRDGVEIIFWLILIAVIAMVWSPRRGARFQAFSVLGFYGGFFLLSGRNEIARYFSIGYPIAASTMAMGFALLADRLKPHARYALLAILIFAGVFTYGKHQALVCGFKTVQWKFHPVITTAQIHEFAKIAEFGENYLRNEELRTNYIEPGACVFLADEAFPYYLKRKYIWSDEVAAEGFRKSWAGKSPAQMHEYLQEQGVTHIVSLTDRFPVFEKMESQNLITRISTSTPHTRGINVWKMN